MLYRDVSPRGEASRAPLNALALPCAPSSRRGNADTSVDGVFQDLRSASMKKLGLAIVAAAIVMSVAAPLASAKTPPKDHGGRINWSQSK